MQDKSSGKRWYAVTQHSAEQGHASSQQWWALLQEVRTTQPTETQKPLLPLGVQSLSLDICFVSLLPRFPIS